MATFAHNLLVFFFFFFLVFQSSFSSTHARIFNAISGGGSVKANAGIVNNLCAKAYHYQYCLDVLNNDPRTPYADLEQLSYVIVNLALVNASDTQNSIDSFLNGVVDEVIKKALTDCKFFYSTIFRSLQSVSNFFQKRDYSLAKDEALTNGENAGKCEGAFGKLRPDQHLLSKRNFDIQRFAEMLVAVDESLSS